MEQVGGKTPATVLRVAHLDDDERALVLGVLLEEVLTWVRSLPGSSRLRALVVFDEVYGFIPPHPASPPTKRPLVALMKQARAYGVGVVLATQNPMDLDYRALSNAGTWIYNIFVVFSFPPLSRAFGNPAVAKEGDHLSGCAVLFIAFSVVSGGCLWVVWRRVPRDGARADGGDVDGSATEVYQDL